LSVDFAAHNPVFLRAFGDSYTLTRSEDLEDEPAATESMTAIPCELPEQESNAPGDGSNYLFLWINAADFSDLPDTGDEVTTSTTVYKIVDRKSDEAGGWYLKCRYDRAVT
jgi:hypothetical protein